MRTRWIDASTLARKAAALACRTAAPVRRTARPLGATAPAIRTTARAGRAAAPALAVGAAALALGIGIAAAGGPAAAQDNRNLAPFVPTPYDVVNRMLTLAGVTRDDVVYDLGCGDGRIVITAAARFGARGVGIDIDPQRIAESIANAKRSGVSHLVEFIEQDALDADVSEATVVALYLLSSSNARLKPILTRQLRPGARVVSHAFGMGDWEPDQVDRFEDERGNTRTLYLWRHDGTVRPS